jgi:GNAT superfamily N-acetyltransferase
VNAAELGELEAFRDLYAAAPPGLGACSKELGDALCLRLEPLAAVTMFNRALGLGIGEPATDEQLDEALDFLREVQAYVTVAPEAEPEDLGDRLAARGLAPERGWTKFSRPVTDPPEVRTELRVARDDPGDAFAEAAQRGFGVPKFFREWLAGLARRDGWQCFAAFDGDSPAAAGALFVCGRVGWSGIGATVPEHRGKGGQSALLAARIKAAAEAGCEIVVTETGEPVGGLPNGSYRNIVRAGFEPLYVRRNYLSPIAAS